MNHAKQINKVAKFIGKSIVIKNIKILDNNTIKAKVVIDGIPNIIHVAETHNKRDFRWLVLMRLAEIER